MGFSIDRRAEIEAKLEEIYHEAVTIEDEEQIQLKEDVKELIKSFSSQINSAKTAFTNIVTCLIANACDSSVDPRYHRPPNEGMVEPPSGKTYFSGRTISEMVIYPWLSSKGFRHAKSGWQTRTFERPRPYTMDYPENIGKVKEQFLKILNLVANGEVPSKDVLIYLFYLEIKEKERRGDTIVAMAKTRVSSDTLIQDIISCFEKHFSLPRSSRLPVLAIYATYLTVFNDIKKYNNHKLLPLSEHSASDVRTNAIGDIEIADADGDVVEAVEVKHQIEINDVIAMKAQEKIKKSKVDRYYILTTHPNCSVVSPEVEEIIKQIHTEHHCELIVNGVIPTMKYYLRLASQPQDVIKHYSTLLKEDSRVTTEHISEWTKIIEPFTL